MSKFKRFSSLIPLAALVFPALAPASVEAGSAAEGHEIATRWCASCHQIENGGKPSASDMVPTFSSIARRKSFSRVQLETWIGNPHPPMPNLSLTRNEIDSLVNYIESLGTPH